MTDRDTQDFEYLQDTYLPTDEEEEALEDGWGQQPEDDTPQWLIEKWAKELD